MNAQSSGARVKLGWVEFNLRQIYLSLSGGLAVSTGCDGTTFHRSSNFSASLFRLSSSGVAELPCILINASLSKFPDDV